MSEHEDICLKMC